MASPATVPSSETQNSASNDDDKQNRKEIFEDTLSGAQDQHRLPLLRSDPQSHQRLAHTLAEFRAQEGEKREERLREVWKRLPTVDSEQTRRVGEVETDRQDASLTREKAEELQGIYQSELFGRCRNGDGAAVSGSSSADGPPISWKEFYKYAEAKEVELWRVFHNELDLDGNGHLDAEELHLALRKAGVPLSPTTLSEFMTTLTSSPHSHAVSFREFRDFLLLLPRKVSTAEIYRYYEMKKYLGDDGRGAARVTMEGDVSLSAEDTPPSTSKAPYGYPNTTEASHNLTLEHEGEHNMQEEFEEEEHHNWLLGSTAVKYLLAGGVAGAVSRTFTAPFDRLKIFLITRPPDPTAGPQLRSLGMKAITSAISKIYLENGVMGFWIGNGLSVAKILPESAIKFLSYESSKRFFAKHWDCVEDSRDISQTSRFLSGGIGGITSQLSIYPIETVKTQMMSNLGGRQTLLAAVKHVYKLGGTRAFYRGLTIGLVGVFPYSAIDMSTFEALKLAYLRSTGKEEPGVLAILAFGSVSGSVGATSVYPLNLVRTRLQASGSPAHPQRYTGIWDVAAQTYKQSGVRGFYIGLVPTLAKVVPAVSISYVVYEHSKRRLGV